MANSSYHHLLSQVHKEFVYLRWHSQPVPTQLVHKATNAEAEGVRGMPTRLDKVVAMAGAGHRPFRQKLDEDGNVLFRSDPVVDADGNPIVNTMGEPYDVIMPAFRTVSFAGQSKDVQHLRELGKRAGLVIARLPNLSQLDFLRGWSFSTPSDLWWTLVFEMAWSNKHPFLIAEKRLWLPNKDYNTFVPYDLNQLKALAKPELGLAIGIPPNWLTRLPEAWVSEIDNMVVASMDAADLLLNELRKALSSTNGDKISSESQKSAQAAPPFKTQRRFAVALSFPGEHRDIVSRVANLLTAELTKDRIFYDKFHEAELAIPNLDLKLQRIYRDDSDLIIVFLCAEYSKKDWCGLEWRAIRDLMKDDSRSDTAIMLLRLDDKPIDGLLSIDGYLDISNKTEDEIARAIMQRLEAVEQ